MLKRIITLIFTQLFALQQLAAASSGFSVSDNRSANRYLAPGSIFSARKIYTGASKSVGANNSEIKNLNTYFEKLGERLNNFLKNKNGQTLNLFRNAFYVVNGKVNELSYDYPENAEILKFKASLEKMRNDNSNFLFPKVKAGDEVIVAGNKKTLKSLFRGFSFDHLQGMYGLSSSTSLAEAVDAIFENGLEARGVAADGFANHSLENHLGEATPEKSAFISTSSSFISAQKFAMGTLEEQRNLRGEKISFVVEMDPEYLEAVDSAEYVRNKLRNNQYDRNGKDKAFVDAFRIDYQKEAEISVIQQVPSEAIKKVTVFRQDPSAPGKPQKLGEKINPYSLSKLNIAASKNIAVTEANVDTFEKVSRTTELSAARKNQLLNNIQSKAALLENKLKEMNLSQDILNDFNKFLNPEIKTHQLNIAVADSEINGAEALFQRIGNEITIKADKSFDESTIFHELIEAVLMDHVAEDQAHGLTFILESALYKDSMQRKLSNESKYDAAHLANIVLNFHSEVAAIKRLINVSDAVKQQKIKNAEELTKIAYSLLKSRDQLGSLEEGTARKINKLSDGYLSEKIKGATTITANVQYSNLSLKQLIQLNRIISNIDSYGLLADKSDPKEYKLKVDSNTPQSFKSVSLSKSEIMDLRLKQGKSFWNIHTADLNNFLNDSSVRMVNNNPNLWLDSKGVLHLLLSDQNASLIDQTALRTAQKNNVEAIKANEMATKAAEEAIKKAHSAPTAQANLQRSVIEQADQLAKQAEEFAAKAQAAAQTAYEAAAQAPAEHKQEADNSARNAITVANKAKAMADEAVKAVHFQKMLDNLKSIEFEVGRTRTGTMDNTAVRVKDMPVTMSQILNGKKITDSASLAKTIENFWKNSSSRTAAERTLFNQNTLAKTAIFSAQFYNKISLKMGASKVIGQAEITESQRLVNEIQDLLQNMQDTWGDLGAKDVIRQFSYEGMSENELKQFKSLLETVESTGNSKDSSNSNLMQMLIGSEEIGRTVRSVSLNRTDLLNAMKKANWKIETANLRSFRDTGYEMVNGNPNIWRNSNGAIHIVISDQEVELIDQTKRTETARSKTEAEEIRESFDEQGERIQTDIATYKTMQILKAALEVKLYKKGMLNQDRSKTVLTNTFDDLTARGLDKEELKDLYQKASSQSLEDLTKRFFSEVNNNQKLSNAVIDYSSTFQKLKNKFSADNIANASVNGADIVTAIALINGVKIDTAGNIFFKSKLEDNKTLRSLILSNSDTIIAVTDNRSNRELMSKIFQDLYATNNISPASTGRFSQAA